MDFLITPAYAASQVDLGQEYSFGNITTLGQAIGYLLPLAFSIAGLAVVMYFLIGALRYITSGGDKGAIDGAQKMITHSIIGLVLLILLFVIIQFVPEIFGIKFSFLSTK